VTLDLIGSLFKQFIPGSWNFLGLQQLNDFWRYDWKIVALQFCEEDNISVCKASCNGLDAHNIVGGQPAANSKLRHLALMTS